LRKTGAARHGTTGDLSGSSRLMYSWHEHGQHDAMIAATALALVLSV
jgi:hypothetical protein